MPPSGRQSSEYCTWPTSSAATSLVVSRCSVASAPGPSISNSPMWLTSKQPTAARTVRCSSMMPRYCTGISQPPKGTMRAPALTCAENSGVRFNEVSTGPSVDHCVRGRSRPPAVIATHRHQSCCLDRNVMEHERPLRGARVLLVEDAKDIREVFTLLLQAEGALVTATGTGREAVELASDRAFDVLLTDLGLPDIPGDMVIRHVVATAKRRPWVVVVTGYDEPFIGRAREAGADVVLTKPIQWAQLLDRLVPVPAT